MGGHRVRIFTPDLLGQIQKWITKGVPIALIADKIGCRLSSLYTACKRAGISVPRATPTIYADRARKGQIAHNESRANEAGIQAGERRALIRRRRAIMRQAEASPPTDEELRAAIEAYAGPVTKCPPGVHVGWRPSWF